MQSYDNPKTIVDTVFVGKERKFNRRFLTLANHYLFGPVACTPAAGWEKGQVENQVGNVREWLFTPRARFATFEELNVWLEKRCGELAGRPHPTEKPRTTADCFNAEQALLRPVSTRFDGYIEHLLRVSSTCLVRFERNQYSAPAVWAGKAVSAKVTAGRLGNCSCVALPTASMQSSGWLLAGMSLLGISAVSPKAPIVGGRDKFIFDPWHYLTVLERKPGALRHGVPFQDWDLPTSI